MKFKTYVITNSKKRYAGRVKIIENNVIIDEPYILNFFTGEFERLYADGSPVYKIIIPLSAVQEILEVVKK